MGASHVTDFAKSLQFVQTLSDDNFGEIEVYRNKEGKFIMKCSKSFITGNKRQSDFMKVLQFIGNTKNINIIPVLYVQQYQESKVCISYEKMELYSQYLNFTLQGLIRNKKSIEDGEIWYLLRTILMLIGDLEKEKMKMIFSLNNIFLTLKGIPSVFLYHFFVDNQSQSPMTNYQDHNQNQECSFQNDYFMIESNEEQQIIHHQPKYQLYFKPYSMHFCLAKIILQLYSMQMITSNGDQAEIMQINKILLLVQKQNNKLAKLIQSLIYDSDTQKLLNQISHLQQTNQIKLSTQIRFNKFRYIMTEEQKPSKDLTLNDNNLVDLTSKPITPIHTPILRLRENYNLQQSTEKDFATKNKLLMSQQQQFFKKKTAQNQRKTNQNQKKVSQHEKKTNQNDIAFINAKKDKDQEWYKNFTSQKVQERPKANSIAEKASDKIYGEIDGKKKTLQRESKLSVVGKRKNSSGSKMQNRSQISDSYCSVNQNMNGWESEQNKNKYNLDLSRQVHFHQIISDNNHSTNLSGGDPSIYISNINNDRWLNELKSSKRITQILNEQIGKSKQKLINKKQSTLLNTKYDQQQSDQLKNNTNNKLYSFFNSRNPTSKSQIHQQNQPTKKQTQNLNYNKKNQLQKQNQSLLKNLQKQLINQQKQAPKFYKSYHTEIQSEPQQFSTHQQTVDNILNSSFEKTSKINQSINVLDKSIFTLDKSINALDKSNFLLTLELKKSKNTLRVKELTQRKDSIISQLTTQKLINIKQNNTLKMLNNQKSPLIQKISNSDRTTFEKKKIRLKNDKQGNLHDESPLKCKEKDQNKQNKVYNIDDMMRNSKLRKVNIKEKQQAIK